MSQLPGSEFSWGPARNLPQQDLLRRQVGTVLALMQSSSNTHTHTYMYTLTYTHVHKHTCTYTLIHSYTHVYTHTYTHTHSCSYICAHTHAYTHTYTHSHMYIHTHTHVHTLMITHTPHVYIHTHTLTYTQSTSRKVLPPIDSTVVSSSVSSVLESSVVLPPAKGGEVTGGGWGSLGARDISCKRRAGNLAVLFRSTTIPCMYELAVPSSFWVYSL